MSRRTTELSAASSARSAANAWESDQDYSTIAPARPIMPPLPPSNARTTRKRWLQQTQRRARILANARLLVVEEGYDHVALRRLATRSGVTPPTIYNLIGGREEVLHRAIDEVHSAKVAFAAKRAAAENINAVLAYADTLWVALSRDPEYSRQVIHAINSSDHELSTLIRDRTVTAIVSWLAALIQAGEMRHTGNLKVVAELIHRHITTTVGVWAENHIGMQDLRRQLATGVGLMLLGLMEQAEAQRIEMWLSRLETTAAE